MIVIKLQGGLGNQLFQYAIGRNIAIQNKIEMKFDISSYREYSLRKYELGNFNIQEKFATPEEIKRIRSPIARFTDLFASYYRKQYIKERSFSFDPNILRISQNIYLDGYWQSEKYFKNIEDIIRKEFTLREPLSAESQRILPEIGSGGAVALHVRRGDYASRANITKVMGLCTPEYYREAIKRILTAVKDPKFFVFSDDIEWVKENLKIDHPTFFVSDKIKNKAHEELILMSLCKHNIIANSSFSWWGAWLNNNPDKMVIAPKRWFADGSKDTKDLIPESWITI